MYIHSNTLKEVVEVCERPDRERMEPWRCMVMVSKPLSLKYFCRRNKHVGGREVGGGRKRGGEEERRREREGEGEREGGEGGREREGRATFRSMQNTTRLYMHRYMQA